MPEYCVKHELKVRPVYELAMSPTSIPVSGIGGITSALGYVIINVQIPGVPSYNEEQVALVIQDVSGLGMRVPVILGTPTIYQLCRQMKETEINSAPKEWQHALEVRTTPYHPQSNGAIERVHQTLRCMIAKLDNKRRRNWPDHLSSITHAYNSTRSQITGYSPYFLMMGRRPRLPVDLLLPTS